MGEALYRAYIPSDLYEGVADLPTMEIYGVEMTCLAEADTYAEALNGATELRYDANAIIVMNQGNQQVRRHTNGEEFVFVMGGVPSTPNFTIVDSAGTDRGSFELIWRRPAS